MNAEKTIILARKHLGGDMESSARLCLADAISLYDNEKYEYSKKRALDSLRYSIGIFHSDYKKAEG